MVEKESVNYTDCQEISNEHHLLRRIMPEQCIFDDNLGRNRPSSAAFEDCRDGDPMSVFWKERHESEGLDVTQILKGHNGYSVARFTASLTRSLNQILHHDPIEDENPEHRQPAHVLVVGKKTKSFSKTIAKESSWEFEDPELQKLNTTQR